MTKMTLEYKVPLMEIDCFCGDKSGGVLLRPRSACRNVLMEIESCLLYIESHTSTHVGPPLVVSFALCPLDESLSFVTR